MATGLSLPERTVHIWLVDPAAVRDTELLNAYHQLMTSDEHARWERYRFDKDKHQHRVTRALVRHTLSRYAPHIAPADWRFTCNSHGKPSIVNSLPEALEFNLSHTQNRVALAVTRMQEIGVDVEKIKPVDQVRGLAAGCFTENENRYIFSDSSDEVMWRFFKLWTLKEAYIKACGRGLSISLQALSFLPLANPLTLSFHEEHQDDPARWSFRTWQMSPEHLLSIAVPQAAGEPLNVEFYEALPLRDFTPRQFEEIIGR